VSVVKSTGCILKGAGSREQGAGEKRAEEAEEAEEAEGAITNNQLPITNYQLPRQLTTNNRSLITETSLPFEA
jgi:hypothetical protein